MKATTEFVVGFANGIVFGVRVFGLLYIALTSASGMMYIH